MRAVISWLLLVTCLSAQAGTGKVIKVLPHLLDLQGRASKSPSLYERDAYQAYLRERPELQSGVRFDVNWKASKTASGSLKLRVEVRGVVHGDRPEELTIEKKVEPRWYHHWDELIISGKDFQALSQVTAWRVTLWENTEQLAEQKSFLW